MSKRKKESSTCSKDNLRVISSVIILNKISKTAFLQGDTISRKVYFKPPPKARCNENYIWNSKKPLYDLSDASLKGYKSVIKFILSSDSKVLRLDQALFLWHRENKLIGNTALHVIGKE